jgi:hypothetical protein
VSSIPNPRTVFGCLIMSEKLRRQVVNWQSSIRIGITRSLSTLSSPRADPDRATAIAVSPRDTSARTTAEPTPPVAPVTLTASATAVMFA